MKVKILHLSDLHITSNNISQDIVLVSLLKKIEELAKSGSKPTIVIITGDIAYSGKKAEYDKAKEYIDGIIEKCEISIDKIFIIPGNHDVDRAQIKPENIRWWYKFEDESQLIEILSSDIAFPLIKKATTAYFDFIRHYNNDKMEIGEYGEFVAKIPLEDNKRSLTIIGLNSAIFCGYDGDDQKRLAVGLPQVTSCDHSVDSTTDIIISCVHHPFEFFHNCEKPSLNIIQRFSDIILSGHVHESQNSFRKDGNNGDTLFITSGAAYERRTSQNGFNIIEFDSENLQGSVTFYKYLSNEHLWILNKDINHVTNGVFEFKIKKNKTEEAEKVIDSASSAGDPQMYMVVLDGKFDELNRDRFEVIETHLKTICKDLNVTIKKVIKSSIKIYFETTNAISDEIREDLKNLGGIKILEFHKSEKNISLNPTKTDKSVYHWKTFLRPEYLEEIANPGANFTHSRANDLTLKDLFISPNLRIIKIDENGKDKVQKIINSNKALSKKVNVPLRVVIYGSEGSGKSTLARWWYEKYYEQGYIPILISGHLIKDIRVDKIKKVIQSEFLKQYTGLLNETIDDYEQDRIIILIDDFHKIGFINSKFKANLISNLIKTFQNLFITGDELMQFETYNLKIGAARLLLEEFNRYQITEFGPKLRYELIKKWNQLGSDELEANELIRLNNDTENYVESIIGKSFVPSYPIYLLTILQAKEASSVLKPEFSIHGFYYEILINDALNKAVKNKADISLFYNFITDYCYFLFNEKIRFNPLLLDDFLKFHKQYCIDYKIDINSNIIINTLINSKLLAIVNEMVSISYNYVYYFFVARYLANNISKEDIKNTVRLLAQRVYRDEFANIVMFLTHLSKDQFILSQLLENSKSLFHQYQPLKLEEDVSFINEMIQQLPEQIYKPIDIEKAKEEELKEEEELIEQEKQFDSKIDTYDYDINEDISSLDVIARIIKSIKTIEILGQVTKKYWGELKAAQKFELAEETYMLGLRTLSFNFGLLGQNPKTLIGYLNHIYKRKHLNKNISKDDIDKASRDFLFSLCTMSAFGVVKRITNAVGYEKLSGTFEDVLKVHDYNSVKLINISIKLDHHKSFPWDDIKLLKFHIDKNYLASTILKNLVINYLYVFITSEADKQKICALLDIKMEQQRLIDAISTVKRETPH